MKKQEQITPSLTLPTLSPYLINSEGKRQQAHASVVEAILSTVEKKTQARTPSISQHDLGTDDRSKVMASIFLEPIQVVQDIENAIHISIFASDFFAKHHLNWHLHLEGNHILEGSFTLQSLDATSSNHPHFHQYIFTLKGPIEAGYHRFSILDKDSGHGAEMPLISTPEHCYIPPALQPAGELNQHHGLWGVSLSLQQLISSKNWGIGDFGDLIRLIDWAATQGADFIQLDALHSNTLQNGNPVEWSKHYWDILLLNIESLEDFTECDEARKHVFSATFQNELKQLRASETIAYADIFQKKVEILHLLYRSFYRNHIKKHSFRAHAFKTFTQKQGQSLETFALYQALQEFFSKENPQIQGWQDWPENYQHPHSPHVLEFSITNQERIGFFQYLQWQLDIQLHAAGLRSLEHGLGLGLCLPFSWQHQINSAEVWGNQTLFAENCIIGAAPNAPFQNQPALSNSCPNLPESLRSNGYRPFIDGLRQAMQYAGAIQFEQIHSLIRQFWIPAELSPQQGAFIDFPTQELLGIITLESQRCRCMVIGSDFEPLPPEFLQKKIFSTCNLTPNIPVAAGQITELPQPYHNQDSGPAVSENTLLCLRKSQQPTLSDFWSGKDITWRALHHQYASIEQRDQHIQNRSLERIALLKTLEQQALLPEGATTDPLSFPQMTSVLTAAVFKSLAKQPAKLLVISADDLMSASEVHTELSPSYISQIAYKLPTPLDDWWNESGILTVCQAVRQERPHFSCPFEPDSTPGLEPGKRSSLMTPRSVYRLQFNQNFTFRDAANLIPYLNRLGISHCYASPLLKARSGSPHGYDITNHRELNPDIGSMEDFYHFTDRLRLHGMGLILDIVPNHMGAGKDNPWWMDVLENGLSSPYAEYFDIDWNPLANDLQNKILLAILGDSYGKILENGELKLRFEANSGRFWLNYWEHPVPVDPSTYPIILAHRLEILETRLGHQDGALLEYRSIVSTLENLPVETEHDFLKKEERVRERTIALNRLMTLYQKTPEILNFIEENVLDFQSQKEDPTSLTRLNRLLEKQNYRLANWRVASDEINYRRFFDINDLVALRVEDERVFRDTHELVMRLVEQGHIQGVRIDHPDGLYDPEGYFTRLQTEAAQRLGLPENGNWYLGSPELPFYILIEKILAPFERLPESWSVHGTTGYEFGNSVTGLFVRQDTERELTRIYERFIGKNIDFEELCYTNKKLIMKTALNSELGVLTHHLHRISKAHWSYQDFTLHNLRSAIIEVVACFPVYRTYITQQQMSQKDQEYIEWAIRAAKRRNRATDDSVFDFIHAVLLTELNFNQDIAKFRNGVIHFAMKFQQYSSPVMAKGVEDTAFYRYNRLISLNEVGGDPKQYGVSVASFHYQNLERIKRAPHTLLSTSTHDIKRSEDVRARISLLSEMPQEWSRRVNYWRRANRAFRTTLAEGVYSPSSNDEYLFYQTLIGVWPFQPPSNEELETLTQRMEDYMLKAVREAKEHSSWINPSQEYEKGLSHFVRSVLLKPSKLFLEDFSDFHKSIARFGTYNSISQTLLKLTCPGVPDIYQGMETLTYTLVDPDNRQSIDYTQRLQSLRQIDEMLDIRDQFAFHQQLNTLGQDMSDGKLKQFIISSTLRFRSAQPPLFREGTYVPLEVIGHHAEHVIAFARCWHGLTAITVVPRLLYSMGLRKKELPQGLKIWRDTRIVLSDTLEQQKFRNLFDRQILTPSGNQQQEIMIADILKYLPVGLLVTQ